MATKNKQPSIFIWTKSERAGDIVTEDIENIDSKWLNFTDGTRINKSIVSEYTLQANTVEEAKRLAKPFGLTYDDSKVILNETVSEVAEAKEETASTSQTEEVSVMLEMLKKMSKKNTAEMPVSVNMPSQVVYEMLRDEMDLTKKELHENISLLIESQIDNLRDQLKSQIDTFIKNYYNVRTGSKSE